MYIYIKGDDQKVKDYGVDLAVDMIQQVQKGDFGISGIHISTLNLERSAKLILEKLNVAPKQLPVHDLVKKKKRFLCSYCRNI